MLEKESQFVRQEQVPKSEEPVDLILKKEINLEEKVESIRDFVISSFEEKLPLPLGVETADIKEYQEENKKIEERLMDVSFSEIEEFLGEDVESIWRLTSLYKKEMRKDVIEKVHKLVDRGGLEMVPVRTRRILEIPDYIRALARGRLKKIRRFKKIEKIVFPEVESRGEIVVKGFEKFDNPQAKGEEFVKKAIQFLPRKILGKNIRGVRYTHERHPSAAVRYDPFIREITFYTFELNLLLLMNDIPKQKYYFLRNLLKNICHEAGHALDPRFISQPELSLSEEVEMIIEYEKVRDNEEEFSPYVCGMICRMNSRDKKLKKIENCRKSQESFAETIRMFLLNPGWLEDNCPQRFEFCKKWFNKRFSEEGFTENRKTYPDSFDVYVRNSTLQTQYDNLLKKIN